MSEEDIFTPEIKLCLRITSMINDEGADILRRCLDKELAGQTLDNALAQGQVIKQMKDAVKKRILTQKQYDLLYNSGPVNMNGLDVTMLSFLIRQLHPSYPCSALIWTNPPAFDKTIEADVTRLREIRNDWVHRGESAISESEFLKEFKILEVVLCRMACNVGCSDLTQADMSKRLDKKKSDNFDKQKNMPLKTDVACQITRSLDRNRGDNIAMGQHGQPLWNCFCWRLARSTQPYKLHSSSTHHKMQYRCLISSILLTRNDNMILLTDSSHDRLQAIDVSRNNIIEHHCESPCGVCLLSCGTMAAILKKQSQIYLLSLSDDRNFIIKGHVDIACRNWHYDIKKGEGDYIYVLCETGQIHRMYVKPDVEKDKISSKECGSIHTGVNSARFFDVTGDGDRFYVTSTSVVVCVDALGTVLWRRDGYSFGGLVLYKKRLFVTLWTSNSIAEMSLSSGKIVRIFCNGYLQNPWAINARRHKLYISQYMSELDENSCQEIVVVRV